MLVILTKIVEPGSPDSSVFIIMAPPACFDLLFLNIELLQTARTDLSGKEVFRESILNTRFEIPVLSSGIYIVELGNNAMQQRAPLVIE